MVDFSQLLAQRVEDTVMPEPLPVGTYLASIKGYVTGESSKKKTPYVGITFVGFQPQEDVDQEAWAKFNTGERLSKTKMEEEFYLTEGALFRLKQFLEDVLGMDTSSRSYQDCLADVAGQQVLLTIGHATSQDGKTVYSEIKGIAKAA